MRFTMWFTRCGNVNHRSQYKVNPIEKRPQYSGLLCKEEVNLNGKREKMTKINDNNIKLKGIDKI